MFCENGTICFAVYKAPFPIEAEDYLQVNQSLRKLVNLGVTLFYPSHGEVITQEKVVETIK